MGLKEIVDSIAGWGISWRERAIVAEQSAAASNAALQNYLDTDAATDEEQAAAIRADAEKVASDKWEELQALDTPATEPPVAELPSE